MSISEDKYFDSYKDLKKYFLDVAKKYANTAEQVCFEMVTVIEENKTADTLNRLVLVEGDYENFEEKVLDKYISQFIKEFNRGYTDTPGDKIYNFVAKMFVKVNKSTEWFVGQIDYSDAEMMIDDISRNK